MPIRLRLPLATTIAFALVATESAMAAPPAGKTAPPPIAASPAIPESGNFRLWRTPSEGTFELPSTIWLDEASIVRGKNTAEYWLLRVEPYSDRSTPAGNVSATWFRIAADCAGGRMRSLRTVTVGSMGYAVSDTPQPGGTMAAPPQEESGFAVALRRACTANPPSDRMPRATIIARAIIWSRNAAAWDREVAKLAASPPR